MFCPRWLLCRQLRKRQERTSQTRACPCLRSKDPADIFAIRTDRGRVGALRRSSFFVDQPTRPVLLADGSREILEAEVSLAEWNLLRLVLERLDVTTDDAARVAAHELGWIATALVRVASVDEKADKLRIRM